MTGRRTLPGRLPKSLYDVWPYGRAFDRYHMLWAPHGSICLCCDSSRHRTHIGDHYLGSESWPNVCAPSDCHLRHFSSGYYREQSAILSAHVPGGMVGGQPASRQHRHARRPRHRHLSGHGHVGARADGDDGRSCLH